MNQHTSTPHAEPASDQTTTHPAPTPMDPKSTPYGGGPEYLTGPAPTPVIIGLVGLDDKKKMIPCVISGFADMISVNLVIALARATTVLMKATGLGSWIVQASVTALSSSGLPAGVFGFLDYLLHIGLSFLVPSSSGLAALSSPIVSPIVAGVGWSVETSIMINVAANGLVNLFTPTCGFIMGGLALARVPYEVWLKWARKLLLIIAAVVAIVLTVAMIIL